jgi:hypothetical protein
VNEQGQISVNVRIRYVVLQHCTKPAVQPPYSVAAPTSVVVTSYKTINYFHYDNIQMYIITIWGNLTFINGARIYSVQLHRLEVVAKFKILSASTYATGIYSLISSWVHLLFLRVSKFLNRMTDLHEIRYS